MNDKKVIPIGGGGGGGESIIVDDALSTTSTNPVQNKVITNALNNKANKSTTLAGYGITNAYTKTEIDTSLSAKANNADLSTVAKTGQYSDIKGKPSSLPANGGDSATVNGHTVESDVPANAKFTDTVYTHPSTHAASMITGLATVATSGSYSDLSNKPTIPSIPSSLPANGGNADTVGGFTVGTNVPADAKFTDTVYTLPAATTSALGGVKIGTNISVSSGTISVANGSTSTKGVVQLTNSTSSTSTTTAATPAAVKSAYDLASGKQSPATTLAGYGITNAYTKTETDSNFLGWNRGAFDVDTLVNAGIYMIASGSNVPSGSQYGSLLTMPYRNLTGNSIPDFGTQIFIPNGDDATKPNSMFFRTSLSGSWNAWQEVATKSEFYTKEEVDSLVGKSLGMKATGSERTRASGKYNYGL